MDRHMVFSSGVFLFLFLPLLVVLYYSPLFPKRSSKNFLLLSASLFFYAWGEPVFVFVLLLSVIINQYLGKRLTKKHPKRKRYLAIALLYNIGLLFVFKYLGFLTENIAAVAGKESLALKISLPIGISFFTFQMLSYILDIYYGRVKPQKKLTNLALYISFFPQLISGPIVRYNTVASEIERRAETREDVSDGMLRFVIGLGKKVLLANYLAVIADNIFTSSSNGTGISAATAWLGALAYALQIYFDFSGYSDMAIGLGRMFGFHFGENFNYPYIAASITDFWRRWHISLSTWFRDYVYIPLGGNRVSPKRHVLNLFVVWLLTGIWHGANWTFVVWGLFYFVLLLLEKKTGLPEKLKGFSRIYTLFFVLLAWVLFRAEDLSSAGLYLQQMFGFTQKGAFDKVFFDYLRYGKTILLFGIVGSLPVVPWLAKKAASWNSRLKNSAAVVQMLFLTAIFLISILVTIKATYNPFIYFNF